MGITNFMLLNLTSGQAQSSSAVSLTQIHEDAVCKSKMPFGFFLQRNCTFTDYLLRTASAEPDLYKGRQKTTGCNNILVCNIH